MSTGLILKEVPKDNGSTEAFDSFGNSEISIIIAKEEQDQLSRNDRYQITRLLCIPFDSSDDKIIETYNRRFPHESMIIESSGNNHKAYFGNK